MSWVVWDTSYLQTFYSIQKTAIGNAVTVGVTIFAIIMAIYIVIRIVKMFTKP